MNNEFESDLCLHCNKTINKDLEYIKPCKCYNIIFHKDCWIKYEMKNDIILHKICSICNFTYNMNYKSFFHKFIYLYFNNLNIFFIYYNLFIFVISILFSIIFNPNFFFILLSGLNFLQWILLLLTNIIIYKNEKLYIGICSLLSLIIFVLTLEIFNIYLNLSLIVLLHKLIIKSKRFIYIFSAKYFYIELK